MHGKVAQMSTHCILQSCTYMSTQSIHWSRSECSINWMWSLTILNEMAIKDQNTHWGTDKVRGKHFYWFRPGIFYLLSMKCLQNFESIRHAGPFWSGNKDWSVKSKLLLEFNGKIFVKINFSEQPNMMLSLKFQALIGLRKWFIASCKCHSITLMCLF